MAPENKIDVSTSPLLLGRYTDRVTFAHLLCSLVQRWFLTFHLNWHAGSFSRLLPEGYFMCASKSCIAPKETSKGSSFCVKNRNDLGENRIRWFYDFPSSRDSMLRHGRTFCRVGARRAIDFAFVTMCWCDNSPRCFSQTPAATIAPERLASRSA